MTLIIYDHTKHRVYADRYRHHTGSDVPSDVVKLVVSKTVKSRAKFECDDVVETVLVTAGTGNVSMFEHGLYLLNKKSYGPADIMHVFEQFASGNKSAVKSSKFLIFTDKQIHELNLSRQEHVMYPYGEESLYWGGGANTAQMLSGLLDLTPAQTLFLTSKATDDRISAAYSVVQGLPEKEGHGHDILLHATAPWPDDLTENIFKRFYLNPNHQSE